MTHYVNICNRLRTLKDWRKKVSEKRGIDKEYSDKLLHEKCKLVS